MYKDVTISSIGSIMRTVGSVRRTRLALLAFVLVLGMPATAGAADAGRNAPRDAGLPFSVGDLGWITLAAAVLIVIVLVLQAAARHRRQPALRASGRRRTDP
jgi:hypothetical protein